MRRVLVSLSVILCALGLSACGGGGSSDVSGGGGGGGGGTVTTSNITLPSSVQVVTTN